MSEIDRVSTTNAGEGSKVNRRFDGIIGLNEAGRMVFVNSEIYHLLECSPEDLIDVFEAVQPLSTHPGKSSIDIGFFGRLAERFLDCLLVHHDGRSFRIEYEVAPVADKSATISTLLFLRDAGTAAIAAEGVQ